MVNNIKLLALFEDHKMEALYKALQDNALEEAQKKAGIRSGDATIIKRITNSQEAKYNKAFSKSHPFTYNNNTYYGFLEGHYILASTNNFGYEAADIPFDITKLVNSLDNNDLVSIDLEELKTFSKLTKKDKKPYIVKVDDNHFIGFTPVFLADCLDFCNTDCIYINKAMFKSETYKTPILIKGDDRIGYLLPLHVINASTAYEKQVALLS